MDVKSYVIFKIYNVKQEGVVKIESNCSLSNYLSCNQEPYIINILDKNKYCNILAPMRIGNSQELNLAHTSKN